MHARLCVCVCVPLPKLARDSMSPGQLPVEINVRIDCRLCHTVPDIIAGKVERKLIAEQQTDNRTGWTMKSCGEREREREKEERKRNILNIGRTKGLN